MPMPIPSVAARLLERLKAAELDAEYLPPRRVLSIAWTYFVPTPFFGGDPRPIRWLEYVQCTHWGILDLELLLRLSNEFIAYRTVLRFREQSEVELFCCHLRRMCEPHECSGDDGGGSS